MASTPRTLAAILQIDEPRIRQRLHALDLTPARLRPLARHQAGLAPQLATFLVAFYQRLQAQPELAPLLASDELVLRLQKAMARYIEELFSPTIDLAYVEGRLRIGEVHHRVRLHPQWYLAAYAHLLDLLVGTLLEQGHTEDALTILQRVLFDCALGLDAYGMSLEQELRDREFTQDSERSVDTGPGRRPPTAPAIAEPAPLAHVRLTTENADRRRHFLGLGEPELARLRTLAPLFERVVPAVLQDFYHFFSAQPETLRLVPPPVIARLQQQVASYWRELGQGTFDRPYAASRMRIGMVHERIGLSPQWYLAGLARQLLGLSRAILAECADAVPCLRTLIRAVFFDVSFVIDSYMAARGEHVLRSEGYASRLIASWTAGVAVVDAERRIVSVNRSLLDLLGTDPSLLRHLPAAAAIPIPEIEGLLTRLSGTGTRRASALGRLGERTLRLTAMLLEAGAGDPQGHAAIVLDDVTDLQRMASDLDHGSLQMQVLVDATPNVLWAVELPSWTVLSISKQVLALTGRRDVSFVGRADTLLGCVPAEESATLCRLANALEPGQQADLEHRLQHVDGGFTWVHSRLRRLPDADGRIVLAGATADISSLRAANERRFANIGQLAGGVAHELNNAMTVALGELQMLDLGPLQTEAEAGRQRALQGCQRAVQVTRKLLAFARRQALRPREVDLGVRLRDLRARLEAALGANITVAIDVVEARCHLDWAQFESCLWQMVDNARAAMAQGGQFTLRSRAAGPDHVVVECEDTGSGMTEDVLERACEPFFTTRPGLGAGLGLSMVQGFAAQSGGALAIDSQLGRGTTVRLQLPRTKVATADPNPLYRSTLLVVEDDPMVRDLVQRVAGNLGFQVLVAETAERALEVVARERIDAVFSDVALGAGMDGIALASRLRTRHPGLPIVLSSGYSASQFDPSSPMAQFPFLEKPFAIERLQATLQTLLARAQTPRGTAAGR